MTKPEPVYDPSDASALSARLGHRLSQRKLTVATAESCTGGLAGALFTAIAGSSAYYLGGFVTYADQAKIDLLGVHRSTLRRYGAVSRETAEQMAIGARSALKSDIAVSITGIAGPGGGTAEKPVGTVYIATATETQTRSRGFHFSGDRSAVRWATALAALREVDAVLESKPH